MLRVYQHIESYNISLNLFLFRLSNNPDEGAGDGGQQGEGGTMSEADMGTGQEDC